MRSRDWAGFRLSIVVTFTLMPAIPKTIIPQSEAAQIAVPTVDELVHDQQLYVNVCEEQSAVFRQNVQEFTEAYIRYSQSADVAQPGQNWQPAACDRDAFVAEMKKRCQEVPNSIAEQVLRLLCIFTSNNIVPQPCEDILRCTRNPSMHCIRRYVAAHDGSSARDFEKI